MRYLKKSFYTKLNIFGQRSRIGFDLPFGHSVSNIQCNNIYLASFTNAARHILGELMLKFISITVQACAKDLYEN